MLLPSDPYWDSAYRPDRDRLLEAVARFEPFESVLDLGCNTGPLRRRLRERFGPAFYYLGLDVADDALDRARLFAHGDDNATFVKSDIRHDLIKLSDQSYDIVVSASTLMGMPPDRFPIIMDELRRIAKKAVVVAEDYGTGQEVSARGYAYAYPEWVVTV